MHLHNPYSLLDFKIYTLHFLIDNFAIFIFSLPKINKCIKGKINTKADLLKKGPKLKIIKGK